MSKGLSSKISSNGRALSMGRDTSSGDFLTRVLTSRSPLIYGFLAFVLSYIFILGLATLWFDEFDWYFESNEYGDDIQVSGDETEIKNACVWVIPTTAQEFCLSGVSLARYSINSQTLLPKAVFVGVQSPRPVPAECFDNFRMEVDPSVKVKLVYKKHKGEGTDLSQWAALERISNSECVFFHMGTEFAHPQWHEYGVWALNTFPEDAFLFKQMGNWLGDGPPFCMKDSWHFNQSYSEELLYSTKNDKISTKAGVSCCPNLLSWPVVRSKFNKLLRSRIHYYTLLPHLADGFRLVKVLFESEYTLRYLEFPATMYRSMPPDPMLVVGKQTATNNSECPCFGGYGLCPRQVKAEFNASVVVMNQVKERVANFKAMEEKHTGITFTMFPAVTPDSVLTSFQNKFITNATSKMRPGAVGCALSHLSLLESFLQSKEETLLVVEDDAELVPSFANEFAFFLAYLPDDFEFCHLLHHAKQRNDRKKEQLVNSAVINSYAPWGTVGYLVSREGAKKILAVISRNGLVEPIDNTIRTMIFNSKLKSYMPRADLILMKYQFKSQIWEEEDSDS
eukprot:m.162056 g.162056  ORF g.162056 m.162056 type:complete len:565 (-) comp15195_c0_seq7:6855-8549(-)